MTTPLHFIVTATWALLLPALSLAQTKHYPLESTAGLRLHNVTAEPVTLNGKRDHLLVEPQ